MNTGILDFRTSPCKIDGCEWVYLSNNILQITLLPREIKDSSGFIFLTS